MCFWTHTDTDTDTHTCKTKTKNSHFPSFLTHLVKGRDGGHALPRAVGVEGRVARPDAQRHPQARGAVLGVGLGVWWFVCLCERETTTTTTTTATARDGR